MEGKVEPNRRMLSADDIGRVRKERFEKHDRYIQKHDLVRRAHDRIIYRIQQQFLKPPCRYSIDIDLLKLLKFPDTFWKGSGFLLYLYSKVKPEVETTLKEAGYSMLTTGPGSHVTIKR